MAQAPRCRQRGMTAGDFLVALGYVVAILLSVMYRVGGRIADFVLSTRLQRAMFVTVARWHSWFVVGGTVLAVQIAKYTYPRSGLVTVCLLLQLIPINSLFFRLKRKASVLLSSCFGRNLRVHLPATAIRPRDAVSLREQMVDVLRIAHTTHARSVRLESPLLAADSTSRLLSSLLKHAAHGLELDVTISVGGPREMSRLEQALISGHLHRYESLRDGRMPTGRNGRLMTRAVCVQLKKQPR
ncbi:MULTISPECIES: hypothetical protein [Burkholderia]|uniref:hypothetical protein n=2 Tax=Burkholderiaceae TaxID=119060 RepID=UPI00075C690D|nr:MULTISPECIES: hypothetical protein [Burkholderia]KVG44904.1 hypothetical protein WS77_06920 [Burkholderia sp. MSMB0265]KVG96029.1 hypothetical protein WS82_02330 [Burkholderia sp. MSMB2041]AOJ72865.1 hypothetical protein WS78_29825 [Burkholderia savannae]KVG89891.1 hypothetical protein WS81_19155 [Burkholderia sp. MSMB2040]KVG99656.1 hypothetical protein WS83_24365 [Burkholderia sp. MSMB2042]